MEEPKVTGVISDSDEVHDFSDDDHAGALSAPSEADK